MVIHLMEKPYYLSSVATVTRRIQGPKWRPESVTGNVTLFYHGVKTPLSSWSHGGLNPKIKCPTL